MQTPEQICWRCHNTDPNYFYTDEKGTYCRRCVSFGRLEVNQKPVSPKLSQKVLKIEPVLEFSLTEAQQSVSDQARKILAAQKSCMIYACTGAGKTELTLGAISDYLSQGKKVCFAISRRQVVLEIAKRLSANFPTLKVIAVCQGYTKETDADLIVCTTHQLYRYPGCFDLLILDELDAFPYAGNQVLEQIAQNSCRGQKLLLTATPDKACLEAVERGEMEMIELFVRPHGHPLCLPQVCRLPQWMALIHVIYRCRSWSRQKKRVLLFLPRKSDGIWMKAVLSPFCRAERIHSSTPNKDEIMDAFREKKLEVLVCTTLLERGITVPSVQVLVWRADHAVFTTASLIQILGRVGRVYTDPSGASVCYISRPARNLKECIRQLAWMNSSARSA